MRAERSVLPGALAVGLFTIHEFIYVARGQPENCLWMCNIGLFSVGLGLLIPSPITTAVGAFWLTAGFPLWIIYLVTAGDIVTTSVLAHVGGLILGFTGLKKLGLPPQTWWLAILALAALTLLTRQWSSPEENINLSYRAYEGSGQLFLSY